MGLDLITLGSSKAYSNLVALGLSNVSVNGTTVIFTLNNGETASVTLPTPKDGISITKVDVDKNNDIIVSYSDGTKGNAGSIPVGKQGEPGKDGFSPIAKVERNIDGATITITDKNGTTTAEIKDGQGGSSLPYKKGIYDYSPIPDIHNTGCKGELILWNEHPAFNGVSLTNGLLYVTPNIVDKVNGVFENIYFDHLCFYINKEASLYNYDKIIIKNCKFNAVLEDGSKKDTNISILKEDVKVECYNCTFTGTNSAINNNSRYFLFDHCYAYGHNQDCWKISDNIIIKNCYASQAGLGKGSHADGIQFSNGGKFHIENYRCDAIAINGINSYNAGLYIDYESGDIKELTEGIAKNIYINGGGHSFYTISKEGYVLKNVNIENYQYGCSYHFSGYNNGGNQEYNWFNDDTTKPSSTVYVTSVWKENNKIKFLVTNYTNENKRLIVKTSNGIKEFTINKCPTYAEYYETYTSVEQFPFNIQFEIDDSDWFVAYDSVESDETQIRFVDFSNGEIPQEKIDSAIEKYFEENPVDDSVFYEYTYTSIHPNKNYNYKTKTLDACGNQYCSLYYVFNGENKIRISGSNSGSSQRVGYCVIDESGNELKKCDFVANETFKNIIVSIPDNAFAIYVNGNGYQSPHLEIATKGSRTNKQNEQYLLETFGNRLSYKSKFAWKNMPKGLLTFSFDDSLDITNEIVDLFISKNVPCCFGAIPEKLNMGLSNGETIAQAMQRGINTVGCEVLAHGNGNEIITEDNIDDKDFLYEKFIVNMQKFRDFGFNVRGCVRVGGTGNICNDPRTDVWVRMVYDYCDLYGLEEPYNHPRISAGNSVDTDKANIDKCMNDKNFTVLLFHQPPSYLSDLIDYAKSKDLIICNYAYAYDNYGGTICDKDISDRINAIENSISGLDSALSALL